MTKFMSIIAILVSVVLYWTTANVCKYNFAIDKKTNILNILSDEIGPSIGRAQVYYYKELTNDAIERIDIFVINKVLKVSTYTCLNLLSKTIHIILVEFFIICISY